METERLFNETNYPEYIDDKVIIKLTNTMGLFNSMTDQKSKEELFYYIMNMVFIPSSDTKFIKRNPDDTSTDITVLQYYMDEEKLLTEIKKAETGLGFSAPYNRYLQIDIRGDELTITKYNTRKLKQELLFIQNPLQHALGVNLFMIGSKYFQDLYFVKDIFNRVDTSVYSIIKPMLEAYEAEKKKPVDDLNKYDINETTGKIKTLPELLSQRISDEFKDKGEILTTRYNTPLFNLINASKLEGDKLCVISLLTKNDDFKYPRKCSDGLAEPGSNGGTISSDLAKIKALMETQLSPMMEQIKNIKASQKSFSDAKTAQNALNRVAKEAEVKKAMEKHDALIKQIGGLETRLKKELEKGEDADLRVIKSVGKMLTNQTDELAVLNNSKSDNPKLKALSDKVHESHTLLKSQTNELTKLLSKPKTAKTTMKIDKLKNSMLAVEKVIENQTMNISNTVKKSQNNQLSQLTLMGQMAPMSTQMPMLPMSYSSNSNIDNSHHNKLNNIIESIEKLNPKTMDDKEFESLKPRLNQLDNLDKEKLLGLLDSTLAVDVNSNNSKDLQDIVSYTKKLIASKSNLNSYNTNENNILLQEFKTAIKNKTLRKLTKYDRDILMSTPDSELWKQIIYLNKKYSDQNPYDTTYVPGYVYMPPDKWETRREIPKCINDKAPISSPAFVFGSGVPSNALEFDSKLLPRFSYREEGSGVFTDDEKFNKEYTNSIMEETDRERLVLSASNTDKYVEKVRKQHSTNHRFDDYNL